MDQWKFDKNIADIFESHAKKHIPNYELVIDKTVKLCLEKDKSSKIIDVGCAVGTTLAKLSSAGFDNLVGVDSSQDMINACPPISTYYCSSRLPSDNYDVIIMNWTLHFVENKLDYLTDIFSNLKENGFFILSEKVTTDSIPTKFYYEYKKLMGTTDEEIRTKEQSLKGVMFINSVDWYLEKLNQVGFSKIYIMDASWGFVSFVCLKG